LLAVEVVLPALADRAAEGVLQLHDPIGLAASLLDHGAGAVADRHDAPIEADTEVGQDRGAGQRQQDCQDDAHGSLLWWGDRTARWDRVSLPRAAGFSTNGAGGFTRRR